MIRAPLAAVLFLAVAGCAAEGRYPSLAPRPVERTGFDEPPTQPPGPITADPTLDRQLTALDERLRTIASGFDTAAAEAQRKAELARGRPAGSDPWLDAQTALGALDDWRAQASALATDVEQIAIARAAELKPAYPALGALGDRAEAEATRQAQAIARIQALLAPA